MEGIKINDVFQINSVGFVTANDLLNISFLEDEQSKKIDDLLKFDENNWRIKYKRKKDARDWTYDTAKKDASCNFQKKVNPVSYRPFDNRFTLYTGTSRGLYASPQPKAITHFLKGKNVGISLCKQFKSGLNYQHVFISNKIIESSFVSNRTSEITSIFPLYLYIDKEPQQSTNQQSQRTPNLNLTIVHQIAEGLGLTFTPEKEPESEVCFANSTELRPEYRQSFAPIDILDYIYAVLHSPTYREKYKEFLKIDFPRVPYPTDTNTFWQLVKLGGELRQLHLLESPVVEQYITQYPADGDNKVSKVHYVYHPEPAKVQTGSVYINDTQYFANVPETAWSFYIGGYQPAQKWLKDRKDRKLEFDDILHYQKIIVALTETHRLMAEIDKVWTE